MCVISLLNNEAFSHNVGHEIFKQAKIVVSCSSLTLISHHTFISPWHMCMYLSLILKDQENVLEALSPSD